jgi:N-acetylglucosaminyldiphosphoundecaprenol N-acetyl-beta-D-mannosaminyltransferase
MQQVNVLKPAIDKIDIMGIKVSDVDYGIMEKLIDDAIKERRQIAIAYASANILNLSQQNPDLRRMLNESEIVYPDGVGVWMASKIIDKKGLKHPFNWTDCGYKFLEVCCEKKWRIFFLGATTDIQAKARAAIEERFPNLIIAGMKNGFDDVESEEIVEYINSTRPDIIWVGMSAPKQELWIEKNREKLNCYVVQTVGDIFTMFAGEKKRGPEFMQKLGLEWFFRLLHQPDKYFKRYVFGIPQFILNVMKQKVKQGKQFSSRNSERWVSRGG